MESFTYAATLRNSPMIIKNIEWLKRRTSVVQKTETRPAVKLDPFDIDTQQAPTAEEQSLMELFELMDAD
jgi:hypothetical protein